MTSHSTYDLRLQLANTRGNAQLLLTCLSSLGFRIALAIKIYAFRFLDVDCTHEYRLVGMILVIFTFIIFMLLFTTLVITPYCDMDQSCTFIYYELSDVHNFKE